LAEGDGGTLDSTQMHLGWASGWVIFEPLLDYAARFNDAPASDAVTSVWQHLRATATSPSGFWWARYVAPPLAANGTPLRCRFASRRADGWDGGWLPNPQHIHLRTIGDVCRPLALLVAAQLSCPLLAAHCHRRVSLEQCGRRIRIGKKQSFPRLRIGRGRIPPPAHAFAITETSVVSQRRGVSRSPCELRSTGCHQLEPQKA